MEVVRVLPPLVLAMLVASLSCAPDDSPRAPLAECAELQDMAPEDIPAVVERLNALPPPRDLSCFVASLPRPLSVVATSSVFSLQPADGELAPRIFILVGYRLILSVVARGDGASYLELGELVDETRSIKGELLFPLADDVPADEPYRRIIEDQRQCGFCHQGEEPHDTRPSAFVSPAFKPREDSLVPLSTLRSIRKECDTPEGDGEHCAMMRALFDYGPVWPGTFPDRMATFF
jgi:hypothetical protein